MASEEAPEVLGMMRALWPDCDDEVIADDVVFVIERADGRLGGFLAASIRPWAEGCGSTPVGYVEGWWVEPDLRRQGAGALLMEAAEAWTAAQGLAELASDADLQNEGSIAAHRALGFDEVQRVVCFRKAV
jgi:aminoglycoside 6'-N-acetyltransferase I